MKKYHKHRDASLLAGTTSTTLLRISRSLPVSSLRNLFTIILCPFFLPTIRYAWRAAIGCALLCCCLSPTLTRGQVCVLATLDVRHQRVIEGSLSCSRAQQAETSEDGFLQRMACSSTPLGWTRSRQPSFPHEGIQASECIEYLAYEATDYHSRLLPVTSKQR